MTVSIIKVSTRSKTASVAGAIAGVMRDVRKAEVQAIGAGAVNQAIKAVAIARGYLLEEDYDIICIPSFVEVMIGDSERTALHLLVLPRDNALEETPDLTEAAIIEEDQ